MLEGPCPCTIFCFAVIHYIRDLHTEVFLLVRSSVRSKQRLCFVHSQGQKPKNDIEQRSVLGFITIPL